jgi:NADH:ubiquinone oxidoreductase subunit 5 (subunit L)/multisubunit Na+/H+ antiporter MnhA subunit
MSWLVRIVLVVLGVLALVAGVIYLIEPVHSLPSFFPGHAPGQIHHHTRGYVAIAVGIVLLIVAGVVRRSRRRDWSA